ncbi:hypothetical protein [Piscirickettsia salmonis]|nr:hypothetical protein [Piscirickettsia salmonis]
MLYHVPLIEWPMFINKVMELTAPDGIAVIVIGANRGKHYELCSYINSHYQNSGPLKAFFDEEGYQYTIEQSYGHYYSKSFEDIFEITRFSVLEDALSPEQYTKMSNQDKKRLDELIKAYVISLKNKAGNYVLEIELDFLYIHPK